MENNLTPNQGEFLLYVSQGGAIKVDVMLFDETVWLTQKGMQALFEKAKSTISEHIKHIFEEGELNEEEVVRDFRTTSPHGAIEGMTQENPVNYYNLDVIISVGYRVKSQKGTQFRIWATRVLREYMIKGFAMDDYSTPHYDHFREVTKMIIHVISMLDGNLITHLLHDGFNPCRQAALPPGSLSALRCSIRTYRC